MKNKQTYHRPALGLLLAAAALPFTPTFAQETAPAEPIVDVTPEPVAPAPEVTTPAPEAAAPVITAPVTTPTPAPRIETPVLAEEPATRTTTRTTTTRSATRARAPAVAPTRAPAREATSAAPVAAAPAGPVALEASPPGATPVETLPVETLPVAETPEATETSTTNWPLIAAGALLLLGLLAFLALRRRRRVDDEVYEETAYAEPVAETRAYEEPAAPVITPALATPMAFAADEPVETVPATDEYVTSRIPVAEPAAERFGASDAVAAAALGAAAAGHDDISVAEPDPEDVALLAAGSDPEAGRPWLEFLMRPVRAGMNEDEAVVEFDLTVGNTGTEPARDVRISTFMFAAGSPQESDMERMLIDPPADSTVSEGTIDAGDGARVEAAMTLPKAGLSDSVLPVVVADARYTLPDGSEGRTTASFAIGVPDGEDMAHFSVDNPSGLHEDIEARLRGELQRA